RAELRTAEQHLRRLDEQTADLAGELDGLISAAHDAMRGHGKRTHQLKPRLSALLGTWCHVPYRHPG
ncbi:MAG: hypothetical protein LC777_09890, partial [Actinobacteria bacterium]|nr:hypothetical protein [Actinomycetota bacterium]